MTNILQTTPMRAAETNTRPRFTMPAGTCDAHFHVFEPGFPHVPDPLYTFPDATLRQYLRMTEVLGIERMVLVQPTFYGTDNSLLLQTLQKIGPRCRAVAQIADDATDHDLDRYYRAGVRAIRLDLFARAAWPTGDIITYIRAMAARARPRGWHLQFYTPGTIVRDLLPFLADFEDTFVIDHMGYMKRSDGLTQADFNRLLALLAGGHCYVKLSGPYRVAPGQPLTSVFPIGRALVQARPDRLVWGSDWPHLPDGQRDTGEMLNLLADWAPDATDRYKILVEAPARLFYADLCITASTAAVGRRAARSSHHHPQRPPRLTMELLMKIVCYEDAGRPAVGIHLEDGVLPTGHSDLRTFIEAGPRELDRLRQESENPDRLVHPARFLAPLSSRSALLLAGGNYADHLAEAGLHPKEPVFFAKLHSAVIGPGEAIKIPTPDTHTDWEAELSIIISKPAYQVPAERAREYIFGYTMINDVSARDVMDREPLQITLCKCPDTFCPVGPHILTEDEVPDLTAHPQELSTRVNGVYKQRAMTDTMIHTIPVLVEFLTRTVTLQPGDLMSSGTAGGTGMGRHPQEFMHPGDTVTVGASGIGYLTNPLVAGWKQDGQAAT